jgi:hypothetical protein
MPRHALRAFFERVVIATLPLVVPACSGSAAHPHDQGAAPADMSAASAPDDMAGFTPTVPPKDPCEPAHPPMIVAVTTDQLLDGGTSPECRSGGECLNICTNGYSLCCGPYPADGGSLTMTCNYNCGPTGRRPTGLAPATTRSTCSIGRYLAGMAHLEAASVHAFRTLARQLARHGAPARLVARAVAAARDEVRHTRVARALARRHGAAPAPVAVAAANSLPALETLAADNAVEGCVRETFGALLAAWQARTAGDGEIRAAMAAIADDEAAHAELAWDLDAWLMARLDAPARARVRAARAQAIAVLEEELAQPLPALLIARAGLPDVAQARQLFGETRASLWS